MAFLDGAPDLPQEARDFFDALDELDADAVCRAQQAAAGALRAAVEAPERYMDDNADAIRRYLEYANSPEYRSSAPYRAKRALADFCRTSGYNEVFLPALERLSPSYARYRRALERADAALLKRLGRAPDR